MCPYLPLGLLISTSFQSGEIRDWIFLWEAKLRMWEKKCPHESQKAHSCFHKNGLAGIVKNMKGEAANEEILFNVA